MARRDGTGPMGQGSMTGRGLGTCTKEARNQDARPEVKNEDIYMPRNGIGMSRGQARFGLGGRGRGCRGVRNFGPRCQRRFL